MGLEEQPSLLRRGASPAAMRRWGFGDLKTAGLRQYQRCPAWHRLPELKMNRYDEAQS